MFDLYTSVILITLLFLLVTVTDVVTNRLITKQTKRMALMTCLFIALAALGECIGVLTNGASESLIWLHKLAKLTEYSFAPAIGVSAAIAYGDAKKPRLAVALVAAHALFECVAVFFGWVFSIDAQNIHHRNELYMVYVVAFVLSLAYVIVSVIRNGKTYQVGMDIVLVCTLLMLAVGIVIQFIYSNIRIDYLCIAMTNVMFYCHYYKIMLQVDSVTRLLNRRCYDVNVNDIDSRAVILLFDIDKFKEVNDTYGHSVGDICLDRVAQQLRTVYGKFGLCYRIGGDEFCVILHSEIDHAEDLNLRFKSAIQKLQAEDGRMPSVAIGYAYYEPAVSHIQHVIKEADDMLYKNKLSTNNRISSDVTD